MRNVYTNGRIVRPYSIRTNGYLDPRCSWQPFHIPSPEELTHAIVRSSSRIT